MTLDLSGVPMWRPDDCWELPVRVSIPRAVTALAFPASNAVRVGTRVSSGALDALGDTLLDRGVDLDHATIVRDDRPYDPGFRAVAWIMASRSSAGVVWTLTTYQPAMREDTGAWTWRKGSDAGLTMASERLVPTPEMHAAAREYAEANNALYDNNIRAGREVSHRQEHA